MGRIFLYAHGGSGNHGCEAIVRSTSKILRDVCDETMILISSNPEEDEVYGINAICNVWKEKITYSKCSMAFISAYLKLKYKHQYQAMDKLAYKKSFDKIKKSDIVLSIGGDNYCYADAERYTMMHDMLLKRGAKTVLWGCSVEPTLLENTEIANDIARYCLITARESISYEALKKVNPNTIQVADPAFSLEYHVPYNMPVEFQEGNMVGINISPMIIENEIQPGIAMKNYETLIEYILRRTNMGVALIPHVIWEGGDDRVPLRALYDKFKNTGRIIIFEDYNCMELKGIISRCRFFIGARTHATIAAYSTYVPTIVVGYSVKARGIARDLFGTEKNYVVPVQKLTASNALKNTFIWFMKNERVIRKHLVKIMPKYIAKSYLAKDNIKQLLKRR